MSVIDAALAAYGLPSGRLREYDGEFDRNIRVTSDGADVVLKISGPGHSRLDVDWQIDLLTHLEGRLGSEEEIGFAVPRLLRTAAGEASIDVDGHRIRAMTWVPGTMLADCGDSHPSLLADMGRVSAVLTEALEGLQAPAGLSDHDWIAARSDAALRKSLAVLPASRETEVVEEILAFFEDAAPSFADLPRGVVHQDLNDHNLMVDETGSRVVGVIDFNDSLETIRVADVAIAASYGMRRPGDPIDHVIAVAEGFDDRLPLTEGEKRVVFPLAVARLAVNWAVWTARAVADPTPYGRARSQATWPVVDAVMRTGLAAGRERVLAALSTPY